MAKKTSNPRYDQAIRLIQDALADLKICKAGRMSWNRLQAVTDALEKARRLAWDMADAEFERKYPSCATKKKPEPDVEVVEPPIITPKPINTDLVITPRPVRRQRPRAIAHQPLLLSYEPEDTFHE